MRENLKHESGSEGALKLFGGGEAAPATVSSQAEGEAASGPEPGGGGFSPHASAEGSAALVSHWVQGSPAELGLSRPEAGPVQMSGMAQDAWDFAAPWSTVPVQRQHAGGGMGEDVRRAAQQGVSGSGGSLPHLEAIQKSFGPEHDLSGVRAHVGGEAARAARSMGAEAYATGRELAFSDSPSLHTAAHEAAHVVQQQAGVQLRDGVGQAGDEYERNADAVADRVVRGEPAQDLLPRPGSQRGAERTQHEPVQMYTVITGKPYDRLSDDGKMAVKDHKRDAWAESSNIARSNSILASLKSKVKIEELPGHDVSVKPPGQPRAAARTLKKFHMIDRAAGGEVELTDDCGTANQEILGAGAAGYKSFVGVSKRGTTDEYTSPSSYHGDDNAPGGIVSTTEKMSGEIYVRMMKVEFGKTLSRVDALKEWDGLSASKKDQLSKKYGINKYAVPKVGQGITIGSERDMPGTTSGGYNFHFGFNLMASGHDYITLEDYASSGVKYYFDMYGPASKGQSWAEDPSNTGALGPKTTTMVVQHPESLKGKIKDDNVRLVGDPARNDLVKVLAKGTQVKILRKGINWMKVEVTSGSDTGTTGWILNTQFANS